MAEKKIYKLELYRRAVFASSRPDKVFYFITNPQGYKVTEKDRIGIQKTLGGTWAENFGPDDKQIVLSGDFGLSKTKIGWDGFDTIKGAKKALTYLRKNFIRLAEKAIDDGAGTNDYYLKFYDLSDIESYRDGWIVIVNSFEITRDKSRPYSYSWTLNMIAIGKALLETSIAEFTAIDVPFDPKNPTVAAFASGILGKKNPLSDVLSFFGIGGVPTSIGIWDTNSGLLKAIKQIKNCVTRWVNVVSDTISALNSIPVALDNLASDIIGDVGDILVLSEDLVQDFIEMNEVYGKLGNQFMNVRTTTLDVVNRIAAKGMILVERMGIIEFISGSPTWKQATWEQLKSEVRAGITMGTNKPENIGGTYLHGVTNDDGTIDFVRLINSIAERVAREKTVQEISAMYRVPNIEQLIAANLGLDWDQRDGSEKINIPHQVSIPEVIQGGNLCYDSDPVGNDIRQDSDGYLMVGSAGELVTSNGFENLAQAVNRALSVATGDLSYDDNFGFSVDNTLGEIGNDQQKDLIDAKIISAISQDPRVQSVERLDLSAGTENPDVYNAVIYIITKDGQRLKVDFFGRNRDIAEIIR